MKTNFYLSHGRRSTAVCAVFLSCLSVPVALMAQDKKKNPTSKVFVADVAGDAQIDIGDSIQDLAKKSVYNAQGTIVEVKKAEKEEDKGKVFSTAVYSNGTGAYFDQNTRVEMKRFVQEPFTPNRVDMDVEPSISQTQAFVARGAVGLCNSKQVAGSSMNYATALGSVNIRGKKVVIEATDDETKISMLEGDSTVRGGDTDLGGQVVKSGQQAIIRKNRAGGPNQVIIRQIPPAEAPALDDKVAMACMAKKTVYFEVREKKDALAIGGGENTTSAGPTNDTGTTGDSSTVSAFDSTTPTTSSSVSRGEIVAVPVVPSELPVQFTVSPATLQAPAPTR